MYQCHTDSFIHCFCSTSKYFIIAESLIEQPTKVVLFYIRKDDPTNCTIIANHIGISINRDTAPHVRIVKGMLIAGTGTIHLVVNTSDGILVYPFGSTRGNIKNNESCKWTLPNVQDTIESMDIDEDADDHTDLVLVTKLGHVYCVRYESVNNRISTLQRYKNLDNVATDCINSVKCSQGEIALASFDNFVYAWIDRKLESQHISHIPMDTSVDHTVTSVDFVKIKKYSSSFLRFYAVNVTNIGCILYKRSLRGQWEMAQVLARDEASAEEVTPLVQCTIHHGTGSNDLTIMSGSESGKLYIWKYRYASDEITFESQLSAASSGVIHNIVMSDASTINYLMNDDTCIATLCI